MSDNGPRSIHAVTSGPPALELDKVHGGMGLKRLVGRVHYFPKLDSTNIYARRLAENGAPEGEMVIAEAQTRGRGRLGRIWVSPSRANIYLSVILRPKSAPVDAPQLTLMAAVALADCVASFISARPAIKWPNDILVDGKKLAGVLTESSCGATGIEFVVLGIGINVNFALDQMPEAIRAHATSLMMIRRQTLSREAVLRRLLQDLDRCYGVFEESGFQSIAPRWESYFGLRGKKVRVDAIGESFVGRATGIDGDGALIIEDECGKFQRVIAGDVTAVEE